MSTSISKLPSYDLELVRAAASRQWPSVLSKITNKPLEVFEGSHQPCPQCGGSDRYRPFRDESGGAICNQCFKDQNSDGFAVIRWLNGCDFQTAIHEVATTLGVSPNKNGKKSRRTKADPAKDLEFSDRPVTENGAVAVWCLKWKPGTTPAAIAACHGRTAKYQGKYQVIALPVFGPKLLKAKPVGWCLYNLAGGTLPKFVAKGKPPEEVKVKLAFGSQAGWIGNVERLGEASTIWKVEGPTDALAALSLEGIPDDVAIIANANGATENPQPWMLEDFAGRKVYVLHDADKPGQEGAMWVERSDGKRRPGWAPMAATKASECRNVHLPFEVAESKGKDLRDWVNA